MASDAHLMGGRGSGRRRPTYLADSRIAAILSALSSGTTRTAAAGYAGINRTTLYRWIERRPSFAQAVEKAEADFEVRAVATLAKAAQRGSWRAAAWLLERRRPADWGPRARLDVQIELEAEVRRLASAVGVDFETAMAEAEAILLDSRREERPRGSRSL